LTDEHARPIGLAAESRSWSQLPGGISYGKSFHFFASVTPLRWEQFHINTMRLRRSIYSIPSEIFIECLCIEHGAYFQIDQFCMLVVDNRTRFTHLHTGLTFAARPASQAALSFCNRLLGRKAQFHLAVAADPFFNRDGRY